MNLSEQEMLSLFEVVFPKLPQDKKLAILVDFPINEDEDNEDWKMRREIAKQWFVMLRNLESKLSLKVDLVVYENVQSNNADLPTLLYRNNKIPNALGENTSKEDAIPLEKMFNDYQIFMVLSEYSATAPMKIAARKYQFRAATMAGFSNKMLGALRIDYNQVNHRLQILKDKLDSAKTVNIEFEVSNKRFVTKFDIDTKKSNISGGKFPEPGMVGNLPSGETYIVPNENKESFTEGVLPVQFDNEVVLYRIQNNKATDVISYGNYSSLERKRISEEPAYGNIAELGFGVLGDFGVTPIGEVLLDEKLGFHIAFGRSDHFGGEVGPKQFSTPEKVIHIDYVYIEETQPLVQVTKMEFCFEDDDCEVIMVNGKYSSSMW